MTGNQSWQMTAPGMSGLKLGPALVRKPGYDEIRVDMKAASVNSRDLAILDGHYGVALPLIPLSDGAGVVAEVGQGVSEFKAGDRVASAFYPYWPAGPATAENHRASLGCEMGGVLTRSVTLPATAFMKFPDHLSFEEAATLPCAAVTAWSALMTKARLQPGQHVLIQGTGGVAMFALQLAKLCNATVTLLTSSEDKAEKARALGADHIINYRQSPAWAESVSKLTSGAGVDVIIELGGGDTLAQSLKAIKVGGHIAVIGTLSGLTAPVFIGDILFRHVTLHGVTVGNRQEMRALFDAVAATGLRPVIGQRFAFEDAPQAFAALQAARHMGKLVIRI